MSQLQELAQRVEHLLLRYEELKRTNSLLQQQVNGLEQEQHILQLRLNTAKARIDSLLSRIPESPESEKNTTGSDRPNTELGSTHFPDISR